MKLYVQVVHRAVRFVDRLIDRTLLVEPQHVQASPASKQEIKHGPDLVPENIRLLGCELRPPPLFPASQDVQQADPSPRRIAAWRRHASGKKGQFTSRPTTRSRKR
jgi:hypothetical protein